MKLWSQVHKSSKTASAAQDPETPACDGKRTEVEKVKLPYLSEGEQSYTTHDRLRDNIRVKLIECLQTPPKSEKDMQYPTSRLATALRLACEIESEIHANHTTAEQKMEKFRALYYKLSAKYTEIKFDILDEKLSTQKLCQMSD